MNLHRSLVTNPPRHPLISATSTSDARILQLGAPVMDPGSSFFCGFIPPPLGLSSVHQDTLSLATVIGCATDKSSHISLYSSQAKVSVHAYLVSNSNKEFAKKVWICLPGDVLKQLFSGKRRQLQLPRPQTEKAGASGSSNDIESRGSRLDSQDHFKTAINLHGLDDILVVVPNVRDVDGSLIPPSEYSKRSENFTPVAVEALLRLRVRSTY
ncbi:uncharacterized protein EDB93DRAFT_544852 [Suillus bovinus]|uniref:uncharacterized protein n=1 Tax=Suillus bovinus TaxID=48563 RepID=UPI001B862829|nr:uncharacterized protein EDB93DRAFT_544852 [Suillus bovinus]KAG2144124.1 hypothetical protein EDB93DRAFT_544852 [Suillus bovinus]